jgi:hypothetical protein
VRVNSNAFYNGYDYMYKGVFFEIQVQCILNILVKQIILLKFLVYWEFWAVENGIIEFKAGLSYDKLLYCDREIYSIQ